MLFSSDTDPQDQTLAQPGATLRLPIQDASPYLVVLFPRELHGRHRLGSRPLILGRSSDCDIAIADEMISRRHCEVRWDGKSALVRDLKSTNGTFVDGVQISEQKLGPDSRLQVGKAILKVEFKDASELKLDKELFEAATTDGLTRIGNRRWFMERSQTELAMARRAQRLVHLILLDVDFFKKVNDTHGHPAGDFVLREVAEVLRREKREEDLLARFGGEEFILLAREISAEQAQAFAERLRKAVETHRFFFEEKAIPITISLGLCSAQGKSEETLDTLISHADQALYRSKEEGRNRTTVAALGAAT